ncbi:MAG: cyclic pyranopterin monophosphate synthase MoaC [Acidimicrobiaceae bacterium]|nr:cyclic pyranopterin monophosphate synthase MoaC [Acidimicrobiaceae bacterium]
MDENRESVAIEDSTVRARGRISMAESTRARVAQNTVAKGDVLATARFAALQVLSSPASASPFRPESPVEATIEFHFEEGAIVVDVSLRASGVRSPMTAALSAATVALLSVYDMCKALDRSMAIGPVVLVDT